MDVTVDALETALGLPVRPDAASDVLLAHRGVLARAVKADNLYSLLDSLNDLLKRLMRRWPHDKERPAMTALYGLEKGLQGAILTDRRDRAAKHLAYDATTFPQADRGQARSPVRSRHLPGPHPLQLADQVRAAALREQW